MYSYVMGNVTATAEPTELRLGGSSPEGEGKRGDTSTAGPERRAGCPLQRARTWASGAALQEQL